MNKSWSYLTTQFGKTIKEPTENDFINQLKTITDDKEHPNFWIEVGFSDDSKLVLDYYRKGDVIFSKYKNQDDSEPVLEYKRPESSFGLIYLCRCFSNLMTHNLEDQKILFNKTS